MLRIIVIALLMIAPSAFAQDELGTLELRWQQELAARKQGTEQMLFGHRIARDDLKLAIDSLRRELASAPATARPEIEARIASTVAALNTLRAGQAAEVESRARESEQMARSHADERSRLLASSRTLFDDRTATALQSREDARTGLESARREVAALEGQRAVSELELAAGQRATLTRRQAAAAALEVRVTALQEPLPEMARRAAATTYMDDRARIERDAKAIQLEIARVREDSDLDQERQDAADAAEQATRAAALSSLITRLGAAQQVLVRAEAGLQSAELAFQAARADAARFTASATATR